MKYKNTYSTFAEDEIAKEPTDGSQMAPGSAYETQRASNQMNHYFDTRSHAFELPQEETVNKEAPVKITKRDIARFKKRKEKRQKIKNKWLYE